MNPRLAARPLDIKRKLPVPYAQLMREDGTADYAVVDGYKVTKCGIDRLCGLCGQELCYWIAFIGGKKSADFGTYADPPMHVECAEDAFTLCPHLARPLVARRPNHSNVGTVHEGFVPGKPETWAMYITRDFKMVNQKTIDGGIAPMFKPSPAKFIRLWEYVDGKAVEVKDAR